MQKRQRGDRCLSRKHITKAPGIMNRVSIHERIHHGETQAWEEGHAAYSKGDEYKYRHRQKIR